MLPPGIFLVLVCLLSIYNRLYYIPVSALTQAIKNIRQDIMSGFKRGQGGDKRAAGDREDFRTIRMLLLLVSVLFLFC